MLNAVYSLIIILLLYCCHGNAYAGTAKLIKPARLKQGDSVTLISPSHLTTPEQVQFARERLQALGLQVITPPSLLEEYGQFAGTAKSRAKEINDAFANKTIKAIFAVRGGSGAGNVLPHLDYDLIKKNPKILIGFSDITALLLAINHKSDLVTFHGPAIGYPVPEFTANYLRASLFQSTESLTLANPKRSDRKLDLIQTEDRTHTINPGITTGKLIGGNLTVLTSLLGSEYLSQDWSEQILFIEDVGEEIYRIDVMLGQLDNAGILKQVRGVVFGTCAECGTETFHSFRLDQVLRRYLEPTKVPSYYGALIGHQAEQFTLPIGADVRLDADKGTLTVLENVTLKSIH